MNENLVIGFIGGGNMAKAIAGGILRKGVISSSQIIVSALSKSTLSEWDSMSVRTTHSNSEVVKEADIVFLAFKPYQLNTVMTNLEKEAPVTSKSRLFVSILAGITSDVIYSKLTVQVQPNARLIRVMPNTPLMVCEGCSVVACHSSANLNDQKDIEKIFSSIGKCEVVSESTLVAVTGLTGSGPAFIYVIIEALSDGAVKQGLPRDLATKFAAQMVLGAAKMVLETGKHPAVLKEEVCSAGGTTIYGIHELEKGSLRATLMNAVQAASLRGKEISELAKK